MEYFVKAIWCIFALFKIFLSPLFLLMFAQSRKLRKRRRETLQKVVESCRHPKIPHSPWGAQLKMVVAFLPTSKGVRRSWFPGRSSIATKDPSTKGKADTCNVKHFRNGPRRKEAWNNSEEPRHKILKTREDRRRRLKPYQCLIAILTLSLF